MIGYALNSEKEEASQYCGERIGDMGLTKLKRNFFIVGRKKRSMLVGMQTRSVVIRLRNEKEKNKNIIAFLFCLGKLTDLLVNFRGQQRQSRV